MIIVEVADALTDILYVTYGAGHSFGVRPWINVLMKYKDLI